MNSLGNAIHSGQKMWAFCGEWIALWCLNTWFKASLRNPTSQEFKRCTRDVLMWGIFNPPHLRDETVFEKCLPHLSEQQALEIEDIIIKHHMHEIVIKTGRLDIWKKIHPRCHWTDFHYLHVAVRFGKLDMVRWMREMGYKWHFNGMAYIAIEYGHLHILEFMVANGYRLCPSLNQVAVKFKRVEILKWFKSKGCVVNANNIGYWYVREDFRYNWDWECFQEEYDRLMSM